MNNDVRTRAADQLNNCLLFSKIILFAGGCNNILASTDPQLLNHLSAKKSAAACYQDSLVLPIRRGAHFVAPWAAPRACSKDSLGSFRVEIPATASTLPLGNG